MRRLLALTVLLAGCDGCKRPPPSAPLVVAESPIDASVLDAAPAPAAADDEVSVLKSLCDAVWDEDDKGNKRIGCDAHPPFKKKNVPDAPIPTVKGDQGDICHADGLYFGSFTKPGAREVVVSFGSCHDFPGGYEGNFATAMSVVLAENVDGVWVGRTYDASTSAAGCAQGRRAGGHDVLFCQGGMGSFSTGDAVWLSVFDFTEKQRVGTVATLFSTAMFCGYMTMYDPDLTSGFIDVRMKGITARDVNHDGNDDAVYVVERSRTMPSKSDIARFKRGCAAQPPVQPTMTPTPPATTQLEVVSTGSTYALAPESQKIVDGWTAQAGGAGGIGGAAPPAIWK